MSLGYIRILYEIKVLERIAFSYKGVTHYFPLSCIKFLYVITTLERIAFTYEV